MRNKGYATILIIAALSLSIPFTGCEDMAILSGEKAITSFVIGNAVGVIDGQVIIVTVPYGTDLTGLSPVIGFIGSMVNPASGAAQDFSGPVTYRVTADDGSARDYMVMVRQAASDPADPVTAGDDSIGDHIVIVQPAASDEKAINSFVVGAAVGVIDGQAITVTVPYGTDLTNISPVIGFSGNTVSPASGAVQDFSSPVTYRVSAGDGSARDYVVTILAEGRAPIAVNFTSLPYETIELKIVDLTADSENDLSRTQGDTLQITVAGMPVRWFIDGEEQAETGGALPIAALDYPVGIHHVTAMVYKDGIPYSDEVIFRIVK